MPFENSSADEFRKQREFIDAYILQHFGPNPEDQVLARSEALNAYWKSQGYQFGSDEDSFILPDN